MLPTDTWNQKLCTIIQQFFNNNNSKTIIKINQNLIWLFDQALWSLKNKEILLWYDKA